MTILCVTSQYPNNISLVGGFNPPEKYESDWIIIPTIGENKKMFQTTNQ